MGKNIFNHSVETIPHVYIHVPFCIKKCGYCSFYSLPYQSQQVTKYVSYLLKELKLYQSRFNIKPKTIYFGGGTPSLLSPTQLAEILTHFDLSNCEEITLEANPVTLTRSFLEALSKTKINRISLGIQSMIDAELQFLGRLHTAKEAQTAFQQCRKFGFKNISCDLIYGLPNQTNEDVLYSLKEIASWNPEHISTYCLSLDKTVPLFEHVQNLPSDDTTSSLYHCILDFLENNNFHMYEISNFCKKTSESKHNSAYWSTASYLGLGPAAAGKTGAIRYCNPYSFETYIANIKEQILCPNAENVTAELEYIMLRLRTKSGIDKAEYYSLFGYHFSEKYKLQLEKLKDLNLILETKNAVFLPTSSYFISNGIITEFLD